MCRRVYIRAILHLDRLGRRLHQPPKFQLDVVLGNHHVPETVGVRVADTCARRRIGAVKQARLRGVTQEPQTPELTISRLETRQAVLLALIEPEITARAKQADVTEPLAPRDVRERRVEAEHVEPWRVGGGWGTGLTTHQGDRPRTTVTTITDQHLLTPVLLQTDLAVQLIGAYIRISDFENVWLYGPLKAVSSLLEHPDLAGQRQMDHLPLMFDEFLGHR